MAAFKRIMILLIFGMSASVARGDEAQIKIGGVYPLSGDSSQFGSWFQRRADLAAEKLNADGGVLGRKIGMVYEDSVASAATAVSGYQDLKNQKIQFISTSMSTVALAIKPLAQRDYSVESPDFLKSSNGAGDGTIYFAPLFDLDSPVPAVKEFVGRYRSKLTRTLPYSQHKPLMA